MPMKFEVYPTRNLFALRRWRWRLLAGNYRILASGEDFNSRQAALDSVDLVRHSNTAAVVVRDK